jgi:alpha-N-acetylglucosaminidase
LIVLQALLSGVPRGRLLLLDLFADEHPVWSRTACMYGHPFIWCMLQNFGGNLEMYGALPAVAEGVAAALDAAQGGMVGIGMAPEGIEQNPAVYEFMAEMAFKGRAAEAAAPGGLSAWFAEYAQRRYAGAGTLPAPASAAVQGAWQLLARSVYSCSDKLHNTVCDVPTSRPGLARSEIMGWGLAPHLWYNVGEVRAAWELLLQAAAACPRLSGGSSAFVYDLLDVSRELMSKVRRGLWTEWIV